jgi:cell division protein FtsB
MKEFQDRNKTKKRIYSKTTLFLLFFFLILVLRGSYGVYQKEAESRREMERVLQQKKELMGRLENIEHHAEMLKTPAGVENEIRHKFDVVKEGEGVVVIVDKEIPVLEQDTRGVVRKFFDSVVNVFR